LKPKLRWSSVRFLNSERLNSYYRELFSRMALFGRQMVRWRMLAAMVWIADMSLESP
jgi:hypothetical protein